MTKDDNIHRTPHDRWRSMREISKPLRWLWPKCVFDKYIQDRIHWPLLHSHSWIKRWSEYSNQIYRVRQHWCKRWLKWSLQPKLWWFIIIAYCWRHRVHWSMSQEDIAVGGCCAFNWSTHSSASLMKYSKPRLIRIPFDRRFYPV